MSSKNIAMVCVGLAQALFALSWAAYAIFLPELAQKAGIAKTWAPWILAADQALFALVDVAIGFWADKASAAMQKAGNALGLLSALSCLMFIAMPAGAGLGATFFLALLALWALASCALRGPPIALMGKFCESRQIPWLSALSLLGMGLAGAASPFLASFLKGVAPEAPFALASCGLLAAMSAFVWAQGNLGNPGALNAPGSISAPQSSAPWVWIFICALLAGSAFQIHAQISAPALFLRFAKQPDLARLLPIFWVGFNFALVAGFMISRKSGGLRALALGALAASAGSALASHAPSLNVLMIAQALAGAGWGVCFMGLMGWSLEAGAPGKEGKMMGLMFCALALMAAARIALGPLGFNKGEAWTALWRILPAMLWGVLGVGLLAVSLSQARKKAQTLKT